MATEHENHAQSSAPPLSRRLRALAIVPVLGMVAAGFYGAIQLIQPTRNATATSATTSPDRAKIDAIVSSAQQYLRSNEAGKAEAVLREAVNQYPREQSLHLIYAETLLSLGKAKDSYNHYQTAVLLGPDHPEYRFAAGTVASQLQNWEDAETHYIVAGQLDRTNPKYPLYLGQVARKLGKIDEARKALTDAVRLDPDLALGWGSLAAIAMDDGSLGAAQDYIDRARKIDAKSNIWRLMEARILRRNNEPEKAAELLFALPEDERFASADLLNELSMSLGMMHKPNEAAKLYVEASRRSPMEPEYAYQAALWLQRAGNDSESAKFMTLAADLGHKGAQAVVNADAN